MTENAGFFLNNPVVRNALLQAWIDSAPGEVGGHEEGGFILRDAVGNISFIRWPKGGINTILLPPHPNCKISDQDIIASFHTHPNTGSNYLQEPSETDKKAVLEDPDLKGPYYEGEFVISGTKVFLIRPDGYVDEVGNTDEILEMK